MEVAPAVPSEMVRPQGRIPPGIWVLGFVSMLMDISSEIIHSLLPVFMVTVLGAGAMAVGLVEGLAESLALVVKVCSGTLSDCLGTRKPLAVFGYAMSAFAKPLFALAPGVDMVVTARLLDRVGKGVRGAPRDALVADIAPPQLRGAAFGLRQALDTTGAFIGPLAAAGLMLLLDDNFRAVFWIAVVPGVLAPALLVFGVQEPVRPHAGTKTTPIWRDHLRRLDSTYWWVVGIGSVFALARFSEAFLVLRAHQGGMPLALIPLVLVAMNVIYAVSAYPFGKRSDTMSHTRLLVWGLMVLIAADLVLAAGHRWGTVLVGVALWGLHMGMTQGLLGAMIAGASPADLRGTAYGFFNLASGLALFAASALAGAVWEQFGATFTFSMGAACAGGAIALVVYKEHRQPGR